MVNCEKDAEFAGLVLANVTFQAKAAARPSEGRPSRLAAKPDGATMLQHRVDSDLGADDSNLLRARIEGAEPVPVQGARKLIHCAPPAPDQAFKRSIRLEMQARRHHDFAEVRVNADRHASDSARSTIGTRAYTVGDHAVQAKLSVNEPGDQYEQEADRIAEHVMRMPNPQTQRACPCGGGCHMCRAGQPGQERERLQIMRVGPGHSGQSDVSPITHEIMRSPGRPLDSSARGYFELRFGHDFSHVRMHSGRQAEQAARSINAKAFTVGNHIVLGGAQRSADSREGRQLLAHELTHVIQQSGASRIHAGGSQERHGVLQRAPDQAGTGQGGQQRLCGPDITTSLSTMLGTVEPWFKTLTGFQQSRSCTGLGPGGPLVGVNPIMAWDTRQLFLPNTGWLDGYFRRASCGSPRDPGCDTDPQRRLCETAASCGNTVVVNGKCMLAGTANYALFGKMCQLCHAYTGSWNRWDMRITIGAYKTISGDDSTPPKEVASAAYDGTFPTVSAAAENRGTCTGRCGLTHSGVFDFIWEPYRSR